MSRKGSLNPEDGLSRSPGGRLHHLSALEYFATNGRTSRGNSPRPDCNANSPRNRRLVLHFDVRNTVLVADSVTKIPIEARMNTYMTAVAWGREGEDGKWQWDSHELSLTPPQPGSMPYYKYLEGKMVRGARDRKKLREMTGRFTDEEIGKPFAKHVSDHLELLEWHHPIVDPQLTRQGKNGKHYHYFLPSFFKFMDYLVKSKRNFSMVFRTFGMDAHNAIATMDYFLRNNHPVHPDLKLERPFPVNLTPGSVKRDEDGSITFTVYDPDTKEPTLYASEVEIYKMLSESTGAMAFKDDFSFWQDHEYHHTAGKPVWIDPWDHDVHHILFDDHVRLSEKDNIVDLRMFENEPRVGRSVEQKDLEGFKDVFIVQLDLLEAIRDEDYFIKKLSTCEDRYNELLGKFVDEASKG